MDIIKRLETDMISAMKNQEKLKLTVIREIKSAMKLAVIDQKKEMNEELMIEVVSHGIKTRKESLKDFEKGGRQDLIDKTNEEIHVLESYLPEQLEEDEIIQIIDSVFESVKPESIKDMGKIMASVTPKVKGRADMAFVSKIIKDKLAQ